MKIKHCFSRMRSIKFLCFFGLFFGDMEMSAGESEFSRIDYNSPGLIVDLGVGLWGWPLPMDFDGDQLTDMVVACTDKPYNGVYFFRNSGMVDPQGKLPVFEPGKRISNAVGNPQISYVNGRPVVTSPNKVYPEFLSSGFERGVSIPAPKEIFRWQGDALVTNRIRGNHWRYVDYDGDSVYDLVVGIGFWGEYGWDNAWNGNGEWTNGPLHGYVYLLKNRGTTDKPSYDEPVLLLAGGEPIDVYGNPSPCFADFDGDGDLDLVCGEFLDGFTYFENVGSRDKPLYATGRRLTANGVSLHMDLCMITPVAYDFNGDGHPDLVVGDEDGRVAFIENTGQVVNGLPQFHQPRYFRQYAEKVKFGALSSPVSVDWDGDGLDDIVSGNTAGYIGFIKNLGGNPPRWAAPVYLTADGGIIRIMAGKNGSIQGPAEAKWGYSNISVGDWDGDGLLDILDLGIWGHVTLYRNKGTTTNPTLSKGERLVVAWQGNAQKPEWNWWDPENNELVAQWRSTPCMIDFNGDGLMDLVTLDAEGYLAFFERRRDMDGNLELMPPRRIFRGTNVSEFDSTGNPANPDDIGPGLLRMNSGFAGKSGRRTFCFVDWDGDRILDLLMNSRPNASLLKGIGWTDDGLYAFQYVGPMNDQALAGHSTTPTVVDWEKDGVPDLLLGAEDGFYYYYRNPRSGDIEESAAGAD